MASLFSTMMPSHQCCHRSCPAAHASKSALVGEIKPTLYLTQWNQKYFLATHVVVDFMSIRCHHHVSIMHFPLVRLHSSCSWLLHRDVTKGRRRMRRTDRKNRHQHYYKTRGTPIPQQLDQVLVISRKQAESPAVSLRYSMQWTLCQYYHHR